MSTNRYGAAAVIGQNEAAAPLREFSFSDDDFKVLAKLAYDHAGIALSDSKRNLVYSRLSRRLRTLQLETFRDYRELVANDEREIENFINSISTNHTKFFREDHHFDHFRSRVAVPFAQSARGGGLRIWSAGCSSGEEPYTIAVVLKRELRNIQNHDVKILATDIDTEILAKAARGEFASNAVNDVPKPYQSFFKSEVVGGKEVVLVDDDVRSTITFRRLNLMERWPMRGQFDAIFCRNVMIYFDGPTKANLIERFANQIKPGGWLYIGHSESLSGTHPQLSAAGRTIYRRNG